MFCSQVKAAISGNCVNCHTIHNSQDGSDMATYGGISGENPCLTRGGCIGCHAYNTIGSNNVVNIEGSRVPQVWHNNATDLAAGNFKYIKDNDVDNKGHNIAVIDLEDNSSMLPPPGCEIDPGITATNFSCAGTYGCHGDRTVEDETISMKGAHHGGVSGECDGSDLANSYRFLKGVKGHENMHATYPWQNRDPTIHNEYYGASGTGTESTVSTPGGNTISGLCAECHGNFHQGADVTEQSPVQSPWLRHSTDIVLTNSGEYTSYTTYSIVAPVARSSLYGTINTSGTNNIVTPGTDVIMCLSCHGAHATNYYKLMRWDNQSDSSGCAVCHTEKD